MKRFVLLEVETARQDDGKVRVDAVELVPNDHLRERRGIDVRDMMVGVHRSLAVAALIAMEEALADA